jgi:hypothetical protein
MSIFVEAAQAGAITGRTKLSTVSIQRHTRNDVDFPLFESVCKEVSKKANVRLDKVSGGGKRVERKADMTRIAPKIRKAK